MKCLMNGMMEFWLWNSDNLLKLKMKIENGWYLMVLLMLFGLKIWIQYLMTTKSCASIQVKSLLWVKLWTWFLNPWISRLPHLRQSLVVVWSIWSLLLLGGGHCKNRGWNVSLKHSSRRILTKFKNCMIATLNQLWSSIIIKDYNLRSMKSRRAKIPIYWSLTLSYLEVF